MAPEAPKPKMNSTDRTLRLITMIAWLPTFAFLLAGGILRHNIALCLGTIPMSFSLLAAIMHLSGLRLKRTFTIALDVFIASFMFAVGTVAIIGMVRGQRRWVAPGSIILGSYGSMGMIITFTIHCLLILRTIPWRSLLTSQKVTTCPHCLGNLNTNPKSRHQAPTNARAHPTHSPASSDSKEAYAPLNMVDATAEESEAGPAEQYKDARPSTDDETARLV